MNLDVAFKTITVETDADCQKHKFFGSPTVRINALDVVTESRKITDYGFS